MPWFGSVGLAFAERFILASVKQVSSYLQDEDIKVACQRRLAAAISARTSIVVAHSLGAVVAYETLHATGAEVELLVTLGSPLGIPRLVRDAVTPQPVEVPPGVRKWLNVASRDDLVAANPILVGGLIARVPPRVVIDGQWIDTGSKPHAASGYLTASCVGEWIALALDSLKPPDCVA
jgi:pimeloyl-ACP methyl ester carboxylesterase